MTRARPVVLGVDSSTQSTKVVVLDLESGTIVADGRAPHSGASTQDPRDWWTALRIACTQVHRPGHEVKAIAVAGQQHGLVTLDERGEVVVPASLWNNVEAAPDAERLNGRANFAAAIGSCLVASFTIAKLAHLERTNPEALARTAAVCLPHDYVNVRLTGNLATDRGEASGSGWWSPLTSSERRDLLALAVGDASAARLRLPVVLGPDGPAGLLTAAAAAELGLPVGIPVGTGTGDNMAAALGVGATPDELVISLGTSGTAFAVSEQPTADPSGEVAGFADATGRFMPLTCMLNCTRVVDATAAMLGLERAEALDRAAAVEPGAGGLLLLPYFDGERTPNLPDATGIVTGLSARTATPNLMIRAALDGVAAGLAYCQQALARLGVVKPAVTLVGGGAAHAAWRQAIADATGLPVTVRGGGEHAARGAAMQAAALALGARIHDVIARWRPEVVATAEPRLGMRDAFAFEARERMIAWQRGDAGASGS